MVSNEPEPIGIVTDRDMVNPGVRKRHEPGQNKRYT